MIGSRTLPPIVFSPTAGGVRTATLTIGSNDPARPSFTLALRGEATATFSPRFDSPTDVYLTGAPFDVTGIPIGSITFGYQPGNETLVAFRATGTGNITGRFSGGNGDLISGEYEGRTYLYHISYRAVAGVGTITLVPFYSGMVDRNFAPSFQASEASATGPGRLAILPQATSNTMRFLMQPYGSADPLARSIRHGIEASCVLVQEDGKFFSTVDNALTRFLPDGTQDAGFPPVQGANAHRLYQLRDGRIAVCGTFNNGSYIRFLLQDGSTDPSAADIPYSNPGYAIAEQADGKLLVGKASNSTVIRYNTDGTVDPGFQFQASRSSEPSGPSSVSAILVLPDSKILVSGHFDTVNGIRCPRIARLNPDGSVDTGFYGSADAVIAAMTRLQDGSILIGGDFNLVNGTQRFSLARLTPDGDLTYDSPLGATDILRNIRSINTLQDGSYLLVGVSSGGAGLPNSSSRRLLNPPLASTVTVIPGSGISWSRNAEATDLMYATFEVRGDDASSWTALGDGIRTEEGWNLPFTGTLPTRGYIRVKGRQLSSNRSSSVTSEIHPLGRSQFSGVEQWRKLHFGSPVNENSAANHEDADGDGVPNLVEYALGLQPLTAEAPAVLPQWTATGGGHEIGFTLGRGVSITSSAEWSTTLRVDDWHPALELDGGTPERKLFRVPAEASQYPTEGGTSPRLFFRLRFTE